jgi:hypothetical protein
LLCEIDHVGRVGGICVDVRTCMCLCMCTCLYVYARVPRLRLSLSYCLSPFSVHGLYACRGLGHAIVSVCEFVRRIRAPLGLFVGLFWPAL